MSKTFRAWNKGQDFLLPRSLGEFVPKGHVAHFVVKLVSEELDLREIEGAYKETRGYPPHSPKMMTAVLLYGYMKGVYSSRQLSAACGERTDFMVVSGMNVPDHRPLSMFRKRHRTALNNLFEQVVHLCQKAKLLDLKHVAVDGTKVKANASISQNMSYGDLKATVENWFEKAEELDRKEDGEFGEARGDEFPTATEALRRIKEAKKAIEEKDAKEQSERKKAEQEGKKPPSKTKPRPAPLADKQYNFTDPDSGVMRSKQGFIQAYNSQVAVDSKNQVIVARNVSCAKNDLNELMPLVDQVERIFTDPPKEISADCGYCTYHNLKALKERNIRGYIPRTEKIANVGIIAEMTTRLKRAGRRSRFRLRKTLAEPVFGIIKSARGFTHFLMRGLQNVSLEWSLACTAHNLWKLAKATC